MLYIIGACALEGGRVEKILGLIGAFTKIIYFLGGKDLVPFGTNIRLDYRLTRSKKY